MSEAQIVGYGVRALKLGVQFFDMPVGSWVVSAGVVGGTFTFWTLGDPALEKERRAMTFVPTGGIFTEPIMTLSLDKYIGWGEVGGTVWHLFEGDHDTREKS